MYHSEVEINQKHRRPNHTYHIKQKLVKKKAGKYIEMQIKYNEN